MDSRNDAGPWVVDSNWLVVQCALWGEHCADKRQPDYTDILPFVAKRSNDDVG